MKKDLRSLTRKLERIEEEIENLEVRIEDWDKKLADSSAYMELMKDPDFYPNYEKQKEELSSKMNIWEEIQIKKKSSRTVVAILIALGIQAQPKLGSLGSRGSNAC